MVITQIHQVLENYLPSGQTFDREIINSGLINKTYKIIAHNKKNIFILQKLSHIFDPILHKDIFAVSKKLSQMGVITPKILKTINGDLFVKVQNEIYRAFDYIDGKSFNTINNTHMAEQAGLVLGRFHLALRDFSYEYKNHRVHGGNYKAHFENLRNSLKSHKGHEFYEETLILAKPMLELMSDLLPKASLTPRHAHGDPKISNILFDKKGEGICMIDLDTLGYTGWSFDIADALRSYCNPYEEDNLNPRVDLEIAKAFLYSYGSYLKGHWSKQEIKEAVINTQGISLCLAIRYLTDALNENYFAFDKIRFKRAAEHNIIRAKAMFKLYEGFKSCEKELCYLIKSALT